MKRIHLFEFEDFHWFPNALRMCMTRFIVVMHKMLGSSQDLAELVAKGLKHAEKPEIIDLCSGGSGPMLEVAQILKEKHDVQDLKLTFTDLYPNVKAAKIINDMGNPNISYLTTPVDATNIDADQKGLRTMVCSMHHMRPEIAHNILKDAKDAKQPICVFEISDNSMPPTWLWWLTLPINFLMVLCVTPFVRPMTWQQILFTYCPPFPLAFFIAWDGAVSNARTYTMSDFDELLADLQSDDYVWEKGLIKGKGPGPKSYLLGYPKA